MLNRFEKYVIAQYLCNLLGKAGRCSRLGTVIAEWIFDDAGVIGIVIPDDDEEMETHVSMAHRRRDRARRLAHTRGKEGHPTRAAWREIKRLAAERRQKLQTKQASTLQRNVKALASQIGLNEIETAILEITIRCYVYRELANLCESAYDARAFDLAGLISSLLGISPTWQRLAGLPMASTKNLPVPDCVCAFV